MDTQLIKNLRNAREAVEKISSARKEYMNNLLADPAYQALLGDEIIASDLLKDAEEAVRKTALDEFKLTGVKKGIGYSVKNMTNVNIPDEKAAFEWCLKNFTPSLKLDTKTFKTAAKNGTVPDELAQITEEAKVYIESDLSQYGQVD